MPEDDRRPDPDALLAQLQREEAASQSGRLFIFLGMCPGVGKTYAMLQTARQRANEGLKVLVGVVETHGRQETAQLLEGLEVLPRKQLDYRGHTLEEFDIDAALAQRPDLILVDELAHTNAPGSRHAKRYQDVLELLDAGLDVCTTLNVQHIESQVDIVRQISGVSITETVPDSILDRAHEIQLVDLSVEKLLDRMAEGKVYLGERAEWAVSNFFKEGNLTALREMALRFTAEQVDRDLEDIRRERRVSSAWKTNARLLVGVGPSPYAESLIRWTRRAATRLNCPWIVVWVEGSSQLKPDEQERLARSLGLARKLGGEVVSVTGDDISDALLRVARERNASQIVVGKPEQRSFFRRSLADRIIAASGDIDVCVVRPLASTARERATSHVGGPPPRSAFPEYLAVCVATAVIGAACWSIVEFTGYIFVALVFLLSVVLAALRVSRGPVLVMSALSALAWNFFFIPPQFTLYIRKLEDIVMFGMFFIVALSMGHLTSRLRQREEAEKRRLRRTTALLRVTQCAALTPDAPKGLTDALATVNELLGAESALIVRQADHVLPGAAHPASTFKPTDKEWGVIAWSFENKQPAGRFTDTLPQSQATWFPLQTATSVMGVLGLHLPPDASMDFGARQMVEAFALQLALVLEKEHFSQAVNRAEILERSEKLRRIMLDSVSHELKTPLAIMRVALDGMGDTANPYVSELHTATQRLQRVVDNLLHMTRIESSIVQPQSDWCSPFEIVEQSRQSVAEALRQHPVQVTGAEDMPMVRVDAKLFAQALANVLHNAGIYAPDGTGIDVGLRLRHNRLGISVRDHGPGIPPGTEKAIFDKFYRAPGTPAGGTGLGLAIAQGLMRALGGTIHARNHPGGGAEFELEAPVTTQPGETLLQGCAAPTLAQDGPDARAHS